MIDSRVTNETPNPQVINSDDGLSIICNCIYHSSNCFLVHLSACKKYKGKYYCNDCKYLETLNKQAENKKKESDKK